MTKTTKTIMIAVVTTTLFSSCTPVSAREITSVNRTEGTLYGFNDGTGYYTEDIKGMSTLDNLYPLTGIVTDIQSGENPEVDLVTITCSNGNMFSWYADAGNYEINDLASCIMDSKGTKYVTDDEVLLAHYAGGLKHFEQYAN